MVATAVPDLTPRMHAFYAGQGEPLSRSLSADEVATLDEEVMEEIENLQEIDASASMGSQRGTKIDVDLTVRGHLRNEGFRVKPVIRPRLPAPEYASRRMADWEPFARVGPGELRDRRTGLIWTGLCSPERLTWDDALNLERNPRGAPWRIPTRAELGTLVGTEGLSEGWVWTRDASPFVEYAWCGRVGGESKEALRSWRMACWRVREVATTIVNCTR